MVPHAENQKLCMANNKEKTTHDELMEKLKLDEEKEKKKFDKEAKRRAELDKLKNESLVRQAALLDTGKKVIHPIQPKRPIMKSQPKQSSKSKKQSCNAEKEFNQNASYKPVVCSSKQNSSGWNRQQSQNSWHKPIHDSFSGRKNSWKKEDSRSCRSNSNYSSVSDSIWENSDDHFPVLGAASVPKVNVWEQRKSKQNEILALQPQNQYDEDAMLQHALALSIIDATEEQGRRKRFEEEYRLQEASFGNNPEIFEDINAFDKSVVADKAELKSSNVVQSNANQGSNEIFSRNVPNFSKIEKTSISGGARSKLNKIIDSFGGWGLKEERKEKFPDRLSDFVDDIVNTKPLKRAGKYNSTSACNQTNVLNNRTKKYENELNPWLINAKVEKPILDSDPCHISDSKVVEKTSVLDSWENDETLHNGKETFTDFDEDDEFNFTDPVPDHCNVASKKKIDKLSKDLNTNEEIDLWLNSNEFSQDLNEWDDEIACDGKETINIENVEQNFAGSTNDVSFENALAIKCEPNVKSVSNLEDSVSVSGNKFVDISSNMHDTTGVCTKIHKSAKETYDVLHQSEPNSSKFESTYSYDIGDKITEADPVPAQTLSSNDYLWRDTSGSHSSTDMQHLLRSELPSKGESIKFGTVKESGIFGALDTNNENDTPPILPPVPVPTMSKINEINQTHGGEMPGSESKTESPPILPPQAAPEIPPQPLYNSMMLPGISPMFGFGIDPITARQMLMLSNPFFASQLCAMEQEYYRALGMPAFSFPAQTMPNISLPGMIGTVNPNTFSNTMNVNTSAIGDSQQQNQFVNSQSVPASENQVNISCEKPFAKHPSDFDANGACVNTSSVIEKYDCKDNDSWYNNFVPSDNAPAIPPPKPPACKDDGQSNLVSIPYLKSSQSASSYNHASITTNQFISDNSVSNLSEVPSHNPISVVTKSEVTGWGDLESESCSSKKNPWEDDDFGWGTDNLVAKSVKSHVYEDKKTVHRQPARQPQLGRFQNNRR